MHIAILTGQFPPDVVGGAEIQAQSWAERLSGRHRVTVVTRSTRSAHQPLEQRDGFTVLRLRPSRVPVWRTIADVMGIERTIAALSPRPDVLLCFMTFSAGLAGVHVGRRLGIPAVVWIRGEAEYRLEDSLRDRLISPWVWRRARGVLVQGERNRSDLLAALARHAPRVKAEVERKLEVVPNALELPPEPVGPGSRVLSVGRLIADKGMEVVIAACARARLPLTIAGDGRERGAFERLARELGGDVRFAGEVARSGLDALYRDATAFVLASHRGEGMPNAVLEAMSYARPVVVTRSGASTDVVRDRVSGLVVEKGDVQGLADALLLLHGDPGLAAELGANARRAVSGFTWDLVEPRLVSVLEQWRSS